VREKREGEREGEREGGEGREGEGGEGELCVLCPRCKCLEMINFTSSFRSKQFMLYDVLKYEVVVVLISTYYI
jgi:hypothetical protein